MQLLVLTKIPAGWVAAGVAVVGAVSAERQGKSMERAAKTEADAIRGTAASAESLNRERYGEAKDLMTPFAEDERKARDQFMIEMGLAPGDAGTAYMETPGYKAQMDERQQQVQQASANSGSLYSGRRLDAAATAGGQVQGQFYNNYMNMLQNLGTPQASTNLASLGVNQAATQNQQNIQSQQMASGYMMQGAEAKQAARADAMSGVAEIYGGYLAGQQ